MKFKYLGTCAAEGFPAMFCSCRVCEKARKDGGRNIRTRTQALINDDLLIDFPADTYLHQLNYGLDLRKVRYCLITHSHDDHLYERDLLYRKHGYAYLDDESAKKPLEIYSSRFSGAPIRSFIGSERLYLENTVRWNEVKAFEPFEIGGYRVTALKADHDVRTDPFLYLIEQDGKALLYAHDSGYFPDATWDYLEKSGIRLDFVSVDCTCINDDKAFRNHMGLVACTAVKERLLKTVADEKTVFCLNHFSHNGDYTYDELVPVAAKLGFLVSYDTAEFEI